MGYPAYPEMKDSGVEWLGRVPGHWEVKNVKYLVTKIGSGKTPKGGAEVYVDSGVALLRSQNIHDGGLRLDDVVYMTPEAESGQSSTRVHLHDVLLNITGASIGRCSLVESNELVANVNQHVCIFRPNRSMILPRFLHYLFCSRAGKEQVFSCENGTSREGLNFQQAGRIVFSVPPIEEQQYLVHFLNHKTAQIDALIAKKQALLDKLAEKRTALISQAVTKGLDPSVPMKDSSVEWLGEIPAHWELSKLGYVSKSLQTGPFGSQLHSHEYVDDGIPVINPKELIDGNIVPNRRATLSDETAERLCRHKLSPGQIIIGRRGEMGRAAVVKDDQDGYICGTGSLRVELDLSQVLPEYVAKLISLKSTSEYLSLQSVGSTMENLNTSILGKIPVPKPPLEEQQRIEAFILELEREGGHVMSAVVNAISKLRKYRSALITNAVTGKIDVRDYPITAAPEQDVA